MLCKQAFFFFLSSGVSVDFPSQVKWRQWRKKNSCGGKKKQTGGYLEREKGRLLGEKKSTLGSYY